MLSHISYLYISKYHVCTCMNKDMQTHTYGKRMLQNTKDWYKEQLQSYEKVPVKPNGSVKIKCTKVNIDAS